LNSFMHLMGKNLVQDWYCFAKTKAEKAAWDFAETHNLNFKWQSVHQSQWGLCCNHFLTKAVPIFSNTSMVNLLCALVRWYCTLDTPGLNIYATQSSWKTFCSRCFVLCSHCKHNTNSATNIIILFQREGKCCWIATISYDLLLFNSVLVSISKHTLLH
jgi:hypothetical protein